MHSYDGIFIIDELKNLHIFTQFCDFLKIFIMKKYVLFSLMAMLSCFAFVSCGDDDEPTPENELLSKISDNQFLINGKTYDITSSLSVRPANSQSEDVGAHYVDIESDGYYGRFDIGTPLMGISVDLANPSKAVGDLQLSFGITDTNDEYRYVTLDVYSGGLYSVLNDVEMDNQSCFKDGTFLATHTDEEFTLSIAGHLTNNESFALKIVIPEDQVDYWN